LSAIRSFHKTQHGMVFEVHFSEAFADLVLLEKNGVRADDKVATVSGAAKAKLKEAKAEPAETPKVEQTSVAEPAVQEVLAPAAPVAVPTPVVAGDRYFWMQVYLA